jgi:hypothetical protein
MPESKWKDLCERIRYESDPEQMMTLIEELNRTLAQETEPPHLAERKTVEQC